MNIFCIALSTGLTFFLFYFTTPFVAGAEMLDMYKSGWWKFLYYKFTGLGTLLYRLSELILKGIWNLGPLKSSRLPFHVRKTLIFICNLLYYIGILYILLKLNDVALKAIVGSADFELAYGDGLEAWDIFGNIGTLFGMLFSAEGIAADGGFWAHLLHCVKAIVAYIFYSLFFFSVVFGLLENKVKQPFKRKAEQLFKPEEEQPFELLVEDETQNPKLGDFVNDVKEFIKSFVGNIAVMEHFSFVGTHIAFWLIILLYAVVQDKLGVRCTLGQIVSNTLKQSEFMDVVLSFVCSALWTWFLLFVARMIVRCLPGSVQDWIARTGTALGKKVENEQIKRHNWALENDVLKDVLKRDSSDRDVSPDKDDSFDDDDIGIIPDGTLKEERYNVTKLKYKRNKGPFYKWDWENGVWLDPPSDGDDRSDGDDCSL